MEGRLLVGGKDDDVEDVDNDPVPEARQLPRSAKRCSSDHAFRRRDQVRMETIDQHEELLEVSLGLGLLGNRPHAARRPKHLLCCGREPKVLRDPDQANPELAVDGRDAQHELHS
jgi:hypothetical protein